MYVTERSDVSNASINSSDGRTSGNAESALVAASATAVAGPPPQPSNVPPSRSDEAPSIRRHNSMTATFHKPRTDTQIIQLPGPQNRTDPELTAAMQIIQAYRARHPDSFDEVAAGGSAQLPQPGQEEIHFADFDHNHSEIETASEKTVSENGSTPTQRLDDPPEFVTTQTAIQNAVLASDVKRALSSLKAGVANLAVSGNGLALGSYRPQRDDLMQEGWKAIASLDPSSKADAGMVARQLRRVVAPAWSTRLRNLGNVVRLDAREHPPKSWRPGIAQPGFDSREVISDAVRVGLFIRTLAMRLPDKATLHVLKTLEHWFSECGADPNRSFNERCETVIVFANSLANTRFNFSPSARKLALEILHSQAEKLELARDTCADNFAKSFRAERMDQVNQALAQRGVKQ